MDFIVIALRNIARNRRRSALTILSLVIGIMVLINVQGVFRGLSETAYGHMMAMDTAQVQVENADYRAAARRRPLDLLVDVGLADTLRALKGVAAVSARIDTMLEITNGVDGITVMARGVSPSEVDVTDIGRKIVAGGFVGDGASGLLVGAGLARKLGLEVGDQAYFTGLDRHSARNLGVAAVAGIFEFGYPLLDDYLVYLDIGQLRTFLDLSENGATRLVIRGDDPAASAALTERVAAALASPKNSSVAGAGQPVAYEWKIFAESLVSSIETRLKLIGFVISVLFALIMVGIFNTMAMNVQERYREIGTLRAIGLRRSTLARIFLLEGVCMAGIGCAISLIPTSVAALFLGLGGIDVGAYLPRDIPIPFGSRLYASYAAADILKAYGAAVLAAIVGSLIPARRAGRLPVIEALANIR